MKKYLLLFSAFASISMLITSCKLDPPIYPGQPGYVDYTPSKSTGATGSTGSTGSTGTIGNASLLIGKWYTRTSTSTGSLGGLIPDPIDNDYNADDYTIFNTDNTAFISQSGPVTRSTATYVFANNKITVIEPGLTQVYTVTTLTATTLIMVSVFLGLTSTVTMTH